MRKTRTILMMLAVAWVVALPALAAAPALISYQTRIEDASGVQVSGPKDLRFRLFQGGDENGGGTEVYDEVAAAVPSTPDGVFSHLIGSGTPQGVSTLTPDDFPDDGTPMWLEVTVEPEGDVLSPRTRIATVGYAMHASNADTADTLDGIDSAGFLDTANSEQTKTGILTVEGGLIIGVGPGPLTNPLLVVGNGGFKGGSISLLEVMARFQNLNGFHTAISVDAPPGLDAILYLSEDGTRVWSIRNDSSTGDKFQVGHSGTTRLTIEPGGEVGLGTPSPTEKLHLASDGPVGVLVEADTDNTNEADHPSVTLSQDGGAVQGELSFSQPTGLSDNVLTLKTTTNSDLVLGTNDTTRLFIDNGGNIGIGGTGAGNILTVQQDSPTDPIADSWGEYSSRRWKTNIGPLEGALGQVLRLRGVSFDWKTDGKHDIGLIAEEVGEVFPEIVEYEDNGIDARSIAYSRLVSVLIEAIKEQQSQIDRLHREVERLDSQVSHP